MLNTLLDVLLLTCECDASKELKDVFVFFPANNLSNIDFSVECSSGRWTRIS